MKPKRQEVGAYQYRDDQLEAQISETKSQLRELFGDFARPSRSRRKGLQHLADVKPVGELWRGLGRLASLGGLRDE